MKQFLILLPISLICISCDKSTDTQKHSVRIVVTSDHTDSHRLLPDATAVLKLYGFDKAKNTEAFFRLRGLTDKQLNPDYEFHLPDAFATEKDNTMDDPYHRQRLIIAYYAKVKNTVSEFNTAHRADSSLQNSECFRTIAGELQLMSVNKADRNILLVYSDLQENSDLFNCYEKNSRERVTKAPDKVAKLFNDTGLLPGNLSGIEIIFVYQPVTREDDKKFMAMLVVYKKLLEPRGALVKAQANNLSFN